MRETYNLEFKEKISDAFLKTVTAFANYGGGKVIFGVSDNGDTTGVENCKESALAVENKINDSVTPKVDYSIETDEKRKIIILTVYPGDQVPYFYKSKSYKRNDSSTVEIDGDELKKLILRGKNKSHDSLLSDDKDLEFSCLEKNLKRVIGINSIDDDVLKTLELMDKDGAYTIAGSLLADKNQFKIIDMVRFGDDQNTILSRYRLENISILEAYDVSVEKYREFYQFEFIKGIYREKKEEIPETAFREALANALVHRDWMRNSYIQIAMNKDNIVISSPGGLPEGLSEEEYLDSRISLMRNPIIGNVFFRLKITESFGTGIRRIKNSYKDSKKKPTFKIYKNSVEVTLPIISGHDELSDEQNLIYEALEHKELASSELAEISGFGKNKVLKLIDTLTDSGYVKKIGSGRGTKYTSR